MNSASASAVSARPRLRVAAGEAGVKGAKPGTPCDHGHMGRTRSTLTVVVLAVGVAAVAAARLGGAPPAASCERPVAWHDAAHHAGKRTAVAGPVVAVSHVPGVGGEPTFVNIGRRHPGEPRFDVVIYSETRARFEPPPEEQFSGETVCVVGRIRLRDGIPQIVLRNPAAIAPIP
jgi:hypothetical protein